MFLEIILFAVPSHLCIVTVLIHQFVNHVLKGNSGA